MAKKQSAEAAEPTTTPAAGGEASETAAPKEKKEPKEKKPRAPKEKPAADKDLPETSIGSWLKNHGFPSWLSTGISPATASRKYEAVSLSRLILTMSGRNSRANVQSIMIRSRRPHPGICIR